MGFLFTVEPDLKKNGKGPSINYVSMNSVIFDPPSPHVSICKHINDPSLEIT